MTELGVSDEQFVAACEKASENPIHKKIVDQIMAVDNFLAFKRLMVKRNQELNRQAMEMYEKMLKRNAEAGANANAAATTAGADKPVEENKTPPIINETCTSTLFLEENSTYPLTFRGSWTGSG